MVKKIFRVLLLSLVAAQFDFSSKEVGSSACGQEHFISVSPNLEWSDAVGDCVAGDGGCEGRGGARII